MVVPAVRACLRRRHLAAGPAPEGVLEEHGLDAQLVGLELVEDQLRVIRPVVVAHARVVASDDEVRAAVVLAADRMPDCLARARVTHRGRKGREDDAPGRVVALEQHAVALDTRRGRGVVGLRLADERMDEQAVDRLERALRQVLVRAVDRVSGLEADDPLPALLGEDPARLGRVERELGVRRLRPLEDRHAAGEVERVLRVEPRHAGMRLVRRPEAALRLTLAVVGEDVLDVECGEEAAALVRECDPLAGRRPLDREADGERPRRAVREAHVLDDALVVGAAEEAFERRERADREHVEVGELSRGQRDALEALDAVRRIPGPVDEPAAVRPDQPCLRGNDAHARTAESSTPSSSSFASTRRALSSGSSCSVSTTTSGADGAS